MKKSFLFLVFILLFGFSGCARFQNNQDVANQKVSEKNDSGEEAVPETKFVFSDWVNYFPENKDVVGYLSAPQSNERLPALILIPEWWGLNDNMKELAQKFSFEGYVTLVVDLYGGRTATTPDEARALAEEIQADMDQAFRNLQAAVDYLNAHPAVASNQLASVGWCFGGGWSYQMAENNLGTIASVMYYGRFNTADDLEQMKSTILGHFGEDDVSIKVDDVREFQAKLKTLSGDHEVYIYPNAGHAFANSEGENYDQEAADMAWERTMAFLKKYLPLPVEKPLSAGTFGTDENGSWHGEVLAKGYPITEPDSERVFLQLTQTTNWEFKDFLEKRNPKNPYKIPLGCVHDESITYTNSSDEHGTQNITLPTELSQDILSATKEKPIALKLSRFPFGGTEEATECFGEFTTIEKF